MHPDPAARRVHGAEFKAKVMAACQEPGASVAAVAVAHGLNPNLVRKWLVGRGLKRTGLPTPRPARKAASAGPADAARPAGMTFVPVTLDAAPASRRDAQALEGCRGETIEVELRRGGSELVVRWPASAAEHCAAWLREALGVLPADGPARSLP